VVSEKNGKLIAVEELLEGDSVYDPLSRTCTTVFRSLKRVAPRALSRVFAVPSQYATKWVGGNKIYVSANQTLLIRNDGKPGRLELTPIPAYEIGRPMNFVGESVLLILERPAVVCVNNFLLPLPCKQDFNF
jgi:hypothetical protein